MRKEKNPRHRTIEDKESPGAWNASRAADLLGQAAVALVSLKKHLHLILQGQLKLLQFDFLDPIAIGEVRMIVEFFQPALVFGMFFGEPGELLVGCDQFLLQFLKTSVHFVEDTS
jgi:hypothetical protein